MPSVGADQQVRVLRVIARLDELFAGYLRFYGALLAEKLPRALTQPVHWLLSLQSDSGSYHSWRRRAQRFFQSASLPLHLRFLKWESVFFEDLGSIVKEELAGPGLENGS